MKKTILITLLLYLPLALLAQGKNETLKDSEIKKLKIVHAKYRKFESKVQRDIYDEHFSEIERKISKGYTQGFIAFDREYNQFIQKIFQDYTTTNQTYQLGTPHVYVINDNSPNAFTTGFDYYFIHTGLFQLLDNEYQLAAVIGHELAHNYLKHTDQSITQQAEFAQDFQKKMKSIKRSEMIKLIQSQDKIIQQKYDLANQSRKKEIASDSLGYVFYSQLNYPKEEYLNLLQKLNEWDEEEFDTIHDETYQTIFNVNGVSFKSSWLNLKKDDIFAGLTFTEHIDKDSIRSHPNTVDRMNWFSKTFNIESKLENAAAPSNEFLDLKRKAKQDFYEHLILHQTYDYALYHIIHQIQKDRTRQDLNKYLVKIFNDLHQARMNHRFNQYVSVANANHKDQDYHRFLHLLWNIPTPDYQKLADYYNEKAAL